MSQFDDLVWEAEEAINEIRSYHSANAASRLEAVAKELQYLFGRYNSSDGYRDPN